jgi:hypothetical protein
MVTINEIKQNWTDEVDNAGPKDDWSLSDLPEGTGDVSELG